MATDEEIKKLQEKIKNAKTLKEAEEAITEEVEKRTKARNKELKSMSDLKDYSERIQYEADLSRMLNDRIAQQNSLYELREKITALEKAAEKVEKGSDQAEEYKKMTAALEAQAEAMEDLGIVAEKTTDATKRFAKEADNMFSDLATKTAIFGDPSKGMVGSMFKFAASMKSADGAMGTLGKSFLKHFNLTSLMTGIVENIAESTIGMVKAFDEAAAKFAEATGTGDQFTGTMLEMRQEGNAMGVTFENSSKALESLIQNQVGFLHSSKKAQKEMATQVALMDRIGIATDTSAEILNIFTMNMGKSQQASIRMTKSLVSMGGVLGNSQKFLEDFGKSMQTLAVYGDDSVKVFSNLAAAARAAGVEVGTLTDMASKFDTFAEGAETVGKLNALLGSQLSSTEMLLMTEDQRIETLIQQVQISGQSFADMNKFQQMAIANAAGISDMNEAQRIFGMNMKDYDKYQKQMERQAKMQENFNKAIEATIPFQEKFAQFMAEFALFVQPIADIVGYVLEGMTNLMASMDEGTKAFIGIGSAIGLAYVAFSGMGAAVPLVGAGLAAATGAVTGFTAAALAGAPALTAFGAAAGGAAIGVGAFVLPFMGIALAVAGVVVSLGYLIAQFAELAVLGPSVTGVITALGTTLGTLGPIGAIGIAAMAGSMGALVVGLTAMKMAIGEETSAVSSALENLALIATGTSAKAMKGGSVALTTELKEAVQAVMTTKIDISLKISDGTLKKVIEQAVVDVVNGNGKVAKSIIAVSSGVT